MNITIRTVPVVLLLCVCHLSSAQDKPKSEKAEDVRKLIIGAGFNEKSNLNRSLENYVRFGSQEVADKHARGDQFDRLEIKKDAKPHQDELRKKRLLVNELKFTVADRDDVETKGLVAELILPMRVRGEEPFYKDGKSFSGGLAMIHPSELNANMYSFLTKDKTLRQCTPAEAAVVKRNDGVLYHPERASTILLLIFKDKLDVLKDISRNRRDYSVEIEFTDLSWERPLGWGYFRGDAYFDADWDCQKLWIDNLLDLDNPQPVYFATAFGKEDEAKIPEIVRAKLTSLRVVDNGGKVIGGYKLPR